MKNKRTFEIEIPGIGEVILEIDNITLQEIMSDEWAEYIFKFHHETDAIKWLAWVLTEWPPGFNGKHNVDGLADKTTDDLKITKNTLDYAIVYAIVWEDAELSETGTKSKAGN